MLLNIITGGIGSGKSSSLYSLIKENLKNNANVKAILLVPEQFSHTADKTINAIAGGQGPNRIEVLTFSRLISRYIDQSKSLHPSGKIMLILKAVSKLGNDNIFISSAKRTGFISSCSEIFSEFRRYMITPDDLQSICETGTSSAAKLRSLAEIYENYLAEHTQDYTDSDDSAEMFSCMIRSSDVFSDTVFFIDDYSDFLPGHYDIISSLIEKSRGVHITLGKGDDEDLFAPVIKAEKRLYAIAKGLDADIYTSHLDAEPEYIKSKEIRHILKNWNNPEEYSSTISDIEIYKASDPYSEVELTASKIIELVRDKGLRFRDIGVVCSDSSRYLHLAGAVFADYNIPYFSDEKISVSMHPISRTVMSVFDIINENWSYQSVFSYLRAGFIYDKHINPINQEEVDILELYVLKYGIKGKKAWFSDFTKGGETVFDDIIDSLVTDNFDLEALNVLRKKIIAPFEKFLENKSRSCSKIAVAFFEFLKDINLYQGILSECDKFDHDGKRDEAEQFKKVWNCILEVLDQAVITSGDEIISRENFANFIRCGLSQCQISIIPSGIDRVSFGSIQRNSPSRVKALFIIGANQGLIPPESSGVGIISNNDRIYINNSLSEKGKEIAPDDAQKLMLENLKLYRVISAATEKLYISYPVSDESGNDLIGADFINDIVLKLPQLSVTDNHESQEYSRMLSSQKRGFYYMLQKLGEYYKDSPESLWLEVKKWYESRPEYNRRMEFLEAAAEYRKLKPKLSLEKAELLYGKNKKYSITALEKYSQCPFAYYMSRGLYAQPLQTTEVKKSHLGSLIHFAVCKYCKVVENGASTVEEIRANWEELTLEKSTKIITDIMEDVKAKVLLSADSAPRIEYLLSRCEKSLKNSCENIRRSIRSGEYAVVACEKDFQVELSYKNDAVTLIGTIDRIDVMEGADYAGIRIVDYKSGSKTFNMTSILNKLDMQLVLYAQAALNMYKDGILDAVNTELDPKITAIFYNKINEDTVSLQEPDEKIAKEEIKKTEKLDGIIVLEEENDNLSKDTIYEMDKNFESAANSDFLNVSLLKDGELSKKSQVISRKDFDTVTNYLCKTVIETDKSIKSGNIDVSPYIKGTESACNFCDYKQICMFDEDVDPARKGYNGKENPIEIMEREVNDDE